MNLTPFLAPLATALLILVVSVTVTGCTNDDLKLPTAKVIEVVPNFYQLQIEIVDDQMIFEERNVKGDVVEELRGRLTSAEVDELSPLVLACRTVNVTGLGPGVADGGTYHVRIADRSIEVPAGSVDEVDALVACLHRAMKRLRELQ